MTRKRVRLRFSKTGNLRFIGHRDLLRMMERLFRRSHLNVAMSEGFHPKQRVSYVSALALGFASDDEVMEVILDEEKTTEEILNALNGVSVEGLSFHEASFLAEKEKKSSAASFLYEIPLPLAVPEDLDQKIAELWAAESMMTEKANGKQVDLRPPLLKLERSGDTLSAEIAVQTGPEAGVRELLTWLGLGEELFRSVFPIRKATILA